MLESRPLVVETPPGPRRPIPAQGPTAALDGHRSARLRGVQRWLVRQGLRGLMATYLAALRLATRMGQVRRAPGAGGLDVLVTGTFHAENWVLAHLRPLARSSRVSRVRVVSAFPVPPLERVEVIHPPRWLVRLVGAVPARLLTFAAVGLRTHPHLVGGFHLLFNGLAAALVARLVGGRALYFCVGGPAEILGGGWNAENRLFGRVGEPDSVLERRLLQAVDGFDLVVTMGTRAAGFFQDRGAGRVVRVVSGGLDVTEFWPSSEPKGVDLVFVGRLAPIKRVDLFLQAVSRVRESVPSVTATVVGDGVLRGPLTQLARDLGLGPHVRFVGHQRGVAPWLRQARIFVLTSDSEGLALALMEAMLCGLPAVCSRVGDLADLVEDGVNGYLVAERDPGAFAARIVELLGDPAKLNRFGTAARQAALRHETATATRRWDEILEHPEIAGPTAAAPAYVSHA